MEVLFMRIKFAKRTGLNLLAIFFPWIVMLMDDNLGGAIVAVLLQASCIGWIPASMWAWKIVHKPKYNTPKTNLSKPQ